MPKQTENESSVKVEQNLNKKMQYIYDGIKNIIEHDEFHLFNLKAKNRIEKESDKIENSIKILIKDNSSKQIKLETAKNELSILKKKNNELISKLKEKII